MGSVISHPLPENQTMSLEQKIEALTAAVVALTATMTTGTNARTSAPAADVTDVQPKAEKAPKAPKSAAASPQQETAAASPASEKKATKSATYEDVKAGLMAVNEKHGRQLALDCLARLGVQNAKALDPSMYDKAVGIFAAALEVGSV